MWEAKVKKTHLCRCRQKAILPYLYHSGFTPCLLQACGACMQNPQAWSKGEIGWALLWGPSQQLSKCGVLLLRRAKTEKENKKGICFQDLSDSSLQCELRVVWDSWITLPRRSNVGRAIFVDVEPRATHMTIQLWRGCYLCCCLI